MPIEKSPLPLAAARNAARRAAGRSAHLVFLDVDVIPDVTLVADYSQRLLRSDALWSGHVEYLPAMDLHGWSYALLGRTGRPHPARTRPVRDVRIERPELFWSLSFALRSATYDRIGGFDECFVGYGAEDTDFALRADAAGVPLLTTGDALGWHQHHESTVPPVEHLHDIIGNAHTYRRRWGRWPMEGWLTAFAELGLIEWDPDGAQLAATSDARSMVAADDRRPDALADDALRCVSSTGGLG